jgi:hypothetical protein
LEKRQNTDCGVMEMAKQGTKCRSRYRFFWNVWRSMPHTTRRYMGGGGGTNSWPESPSELYRPSDCCLLTKLVSIVADRGCHVSVTNPYGRNLDFLDQSCYFLFQIAPQLYSRGSVDPVPDPLLLRKFGSIVNRIRASGSVGRNSDH